MANTIRSAVSPFVHPLGCHQMLKERLTDTTKRGSINQMLIAEYPRYVPVPVPVPVPVHRGCTEDNLRIGARTCGRWCWCCPGSQQPNTTSSRGRMLQPLCLLWASFIDRAVVGMCGTAVPPRSTPVPTPPPLETAIAEFLSHRTDS